MNGEERSKEEKQQGVRSDGRCLPVPRGRRVTVLCWAQHETPQHRVGRASKSSFTIPASEFGGSKSERQDKRRAGT